MIVIDEKAQVVEKLKELGLEFCDFFDHLKVESLKQFNKHPLGRRPEVVILGFSSLLNNPIEKEDFKIQLNTYAGVVILCQSEEERLKALEFAQEVPKVLGIYGPHMTGAEGNLLGNLLSYFWSTTQEQRLFQQKMYQFSLEIEQLMEGAQEDMMRAKALHEKFLPKRTEKIKGLDFYSKFMAGTGRGVEFFDLITVSNKCYQLYLTTDSYLISGSFLSLLEKYKQQEFDLSGFLNEARSDIASIQESKTTPVEAHISVVEFDLNELTMTVHEKSNLKVLKNGKIIDNPNNLKLSKGEKIIILSAGYMKNLKELKLPFNIEKFYDQHSSLNPHELLNELIFKLKSEQDADGNISDMVTVMVEVNRHGIHQV
ncbi:MAG TPA: hypothetical protein VKZ84_04670 [Bacteriovoracaceae bacterium]|nr:hypothetical protein [Bacteriovoracaceae bacterium]